MSQPLATPYGNQLLIKPLKKKKVMVKGLEIEETDLEKAQVVKVSKKFETDFKEGDVVFYPQKPAVGHTYEGELLQWLGVDDVKGFLTKEEHEQLEAEDANAA
jgi:co-chaperonin GroES (HSP10)